MQHREARAKVQPRSWKLVGGKKMFAIWTFIFLRIFNLLITLFSIYLFWVFFICLVGFLAVLGAHCCAGFALAALSRGSSPLVLCRLLIAVASLVAERRL